MKLKLNSIAVLAVTVVFHWFFLFTKHDPGLSAILPFGEDPYDAIGSDALILSELLMLLCLIRAFRLRRPGSTSPLSSLFLARTQMAIALSPLVALGGDAVAMARHPSAWTGKPATGELLMLMAAMGVLSFAALFLTRASACELNLPAVKYLSRRALAVVLVSVVVLAIYPENFVQNALLHFLTILAGFVLFLAPQSTLAVALLPFDTNLPASEGAASQSRSILWMQWVFVAIGGIAIGASVLIAETVGEGNGGTSMSQILLVSAMFLGAGTSALLTAFAFLRKPLGLFQKIAGA